MKTPQTRPLGSLMALSYQAQHVSDPRRKSELVAFIRRRGPLSTKSSGSRDSGPAPDGPTLDVVSVPGAAAIPAWARDPLFRPLGASDA
jgi:hypothetical protein